MTAFGVQVEGLTSLQAVRCAQPLLSCTINSLLDRAVDNISCSQFYPQVSAFRRELEWKDYVDRPPSTLLWSACKDMGFVLESQRLVNSASGLADRSVAAISSVSQG